MLKKSAAAFGVVFLAIGALGFVPAAVPGGHLLGLFHINALHNIIHLASGAVALWAGLTSERNAKLYFRIFGIVYAAVAVLGFVYGDQPLLGLVANNTADTLAACSYCGCGAVSRLRHAGSACGNEGNNGVNAE